jgi:acyl-CoA thioesterase FadM
MATPKRSTEPASIVLRRRIEWIDTDAAGIYHWTTVLRLAEAAEAALHTALGIAEHTFGATPRLGVTLDFRRALRFNDPVQLELRVAELGRSSIRYSLALSGPDGLAAEGSFTACLVDRDSKRATPWPDEIRELLTSAGPQSPDQWTSSPS